MKLQYRVTSDARGPIRATRIRFSVCAETITRIEAVTDRADYADYGWGRSTGLERIAAD
jgi:hypothetical protein